MESIRNFARLTDLIGTAGQPTREEFELIANEGYETVINLAMPDHEDSIPDEGEIVSSLGMTYIHIPVPFHNPQPIHVKRFCKYMQSLEGTKVFVHCIMNYRVSAFMFHYFNKVVGLDVDASTSPVIADWGPDEIWQKVISWNRDDIGL